MAVAVAFVLSVLFSLGALVAALHIARRDRDIAEYDATVASEQLMSAQVELATVQTNLKREARQLDAVLRATTEAMSDLQITEAVAATVAAEYKDAYEKTASAGSPQSPADHAHILDKLARMSKGAEDGVRKIHAAQFRLHQLAGRDIVEWIPDGRNPIYPNIHAAAREGIWNPDPGYAWCDDIGMQVMWRPGLRHTNDPEKMAGPVEGTWVSIPNRVKGI